MCSKLTPCSNVSMVNFEKVNAGWEVSIHDFGQFSVREFSRDIRPIILKTLVESIKSTRKKKLVVISSKPDHAQRQR